MASLEPWLSVLRVETTVRATYEREAGVRKRAVGFKPDREIDSADTWMFTDGSSKGWHALVVLRLGHDPRLVARAVRSETRNVGAEVAGLVSAFEATLPGERVTIVSDFLWSIYYVLGWYQVESPLLREQVAVARALVAERRPASVRFIHVKGHVRDDSALGRWNDVADRLCALGVAVDRTVPASAFGAAPSRRWLSELI
jgi:RNase H